MIIKEENHLAHYGIIRKSGRYPYGSGDNKTTLSGGLISITAGLRAQGLTDSEIARGLGFTTTQFRAATSIESNRLKEEKRYKIEKLAAKGWSPTAIGKELGMNESSVRSALAPSRKAKTDNIQSIANKLKENVDKHGFIDIGAGVENKLGISDVKLRTSVAVLKEQGYEVHPVQIDQLGTANQKTTNKVLCKPGTTYRDAVANKFNIRQVDGHSDDGGNNWTGIQPPLNVNQKRLQVVYKEQGGTDADGVIYVRRGVKDVDIGGSNYAQVRIAIDGSHYLKGMAVYKDDLPAGVDLQFNTNKSDTGNKLDALKPLKTKKEDNSVDQENPFGSNISRQVLNANGKVTSAMNIVNEEGTWDRWNKSISTQVLSKQAPILAKQQLDVTYENKRADLDEIKGLTNPAVRRLLLEKFADGADSSSVHLAAAALPRQATQVILPLPSLKPNEVYAPNFRPGETVALIRYPHGGKFEIPELVVNNNNRAGKKQLGAQARDAIGIHPKVAERLSGADFDGDTVVVIPNGKGQIKSEAALKSLKGFDPQQYKLPDDAPRMSSRTKGTQMGLVSNLITDMTIKGAPPEELARAVKHSMVVIDAEKHHLDYKRSAEDTGIRDLYIKYQERAQGGSSTLISRATSKTSYVNARVPRSPKDGGPIDKKTGKLVFVPKTYVNKDGETVYVKAKYDKLDYTDDANTLISKPGTKIEKVYAEHSNRLKALANEARIEVAAFKAPLISKSAKVAYKNEVDSLKIKLDIARKNKPLERQAQIFANQVVAQKVKEDPNMDPADRKKIEYQALQRARARTGANKIKIVPSPEEWGAIQAGAVSQNQLKQILDNADLDAIRALATPRSTRLMSTVKTNRAKTMVAAGYSQSDIADALGVSLSTLKTVI